MTTPTNGNGFIPRYGMIISTVGVAILTVGGFWGAVITPIAARQEKLEAKLDQHITIREHDEFKARLDGILKELRDETLRIRESAIAKGEVSERFSSVAARIDNGQRQIDDLRKTYGEIFPSTKVIDQLFNRIDKLESSKVSK